MPGLGVHEILQGSVWINKGIFLTKNKQKIAVYDEKDKKYSAALFDVATKGMFVTALNCDGDEYKPKPQLYKQRHMVAIVNKEKWEFMRQPIGIVVRCENQKVKADLICALCVTGEMEYDTANCGDIPDPNNLPQEQEEQILWKAPTSLAELGNVPKDIQLLQTCIETHYPTDKASELAAKYYTPIVEPVDDLVLAPKAGLWDTQNNEWNYQTMKLSLNARGEAVVFFSTPAVPVTLKVPLVTARLKKPRPIKDTEKGKKRSKINTGNPTAKGGLEN